jgi:hypothetical protein
MACPFYYMRPDEQWALNSTQVTASGTDTDYQPYWATDARPGRPYRSNATTFSLTIQNTNGEVGMVVVGNHNLGPGAVISVFSTSFTVSTETPPDGIPLNAWFIRTPANTTTLTVAASTANSANPVIGEVLAGKYRTLSRGVTIASANFAQQMVAADPQSEFASIPPYDKGLAQRTLSGDAIVDATEFASLRDWFRSQRGWTKPSVIVVEGDAWIVTVRSFRYSKIDESLYTVRLEFVEYPRSRW